MIDLKEKYIVVDVWYGSDNPDESVMMRNGVKGELIRMNDSYGNCVLDKNFKTNWSQAAAMGLPRVPYFVISPWITSEVYKEFIVKNIPSECHKIALDIEIQRTGFETSYGWMLNNLCSLLEQSGIIPVIYTGAWFLQFLSGWPKDRKYWWARYPDAVQRPNNESGNISTSWDTLKETIENYTWTPDPSNMCPGEIIVWQITSNYILPGTDGNPIDVSLISKEDFEWLFSDTIGSLPTPPTVTGDLTVCVDVLNVRTGPGKKYSVVKQLHLGDKIDVTDIYAPYEAWIKLADGTWIAAVYSGQELVTQEIL